MIQTQKMEYIKEIGNNEKLDEQFAKQQADIGWRVEQGMGNR